MSRSLNIEGLNLSANISFIGHFKHRFFLKRHVSSMYNPTEDSYISCMLFYRTLEGFDSLLKIRGVSTQTQLYDEFFSALFTGLISKDYPIQSLVEWSLECAEHKLLIQLMTKCSSKTLLNNIPLVCRFLWQIWSFDDPDIISKPKLLQRKDSIMALFERVVQLENEFPDRGLDLESEATFKLIRSIITTQ